MLEMAPKLRPWLSLDGVPEGTCAWAGLCELPVWTMASLPGIAARGSLLSLFRFEFSAVLVFAVPGVKLRWRPTAGELAGWVAGSAQGMPEL